MTGPEARLIFAAANIVGESLLWDDRVGRLIWIDIIGRRIHRLDPLTLNHESWEMPDLVTSIGLRVDGGAIVGLSQEVVLWDFGGPLRKLAAVEAEYPGTRLNEGVVAPDGSFWVGTMANNIGPDDAPVDITEDLGRIYRVSKRRGDRIERRPIRHHQYDGVDGRWTFRHRRHHEKRALQLSLGSHSVSPR